MYHSWSGVLRFPDTLSSLSIVAFALGVGLVTTPPLDGRGPTVILNEIHYHPPDDSRDSEFVELLNYGDDRVDLSEWELTGGVRFRFPEGTLLEAESYLVLAANVERLLERDDIDREKVIGPFEGSLENDGESLRLLTAGGFVASFVDYEDSAPWVKTPDGLGPSLERIAPGREETDPAAWGASTPVGGTPGERNSLRVEEVSLSEARIVFVEEGSSWSFLPGTTPPPQGWSELDFDDSEWERGPAGFGYADGDDATELLGMQNQYLTVFVRRKFSVEDVAQLTALTLSIDYDDGFVAFINGREVARSNVGSTQFDAPAIDRHEAGTAERFVIPTPANVVQDGDNVIAVAGHNRSLESSDFSLSPALEGTISTGSDSRFALVEAGATWGFFPGTTSPPQDWTQLEFDDSGWQRGPAGFGYADGDDATQLLGMQNRYLTVFLRRKFSVEDAAKLQALVLSIDYDDGFVAFINGREVARSNVGSTQFDSPAIDRHEAGAIEQFVILAPARIVQEGDNVIAVAGHNGSLDSSDFSLSPALDGTIRADDEEAPATVEAAPRDVVINEISHGGDGTGWVELYNTTDVAIDASGMRVQLFPARLGDHPLPAGTNLASRSHLVVSESELGFELDDIAVLLLTTPDGRFVDALNPRRTNSNHSTGRFPDGDDNRVVFPTPTAGAANAVVLDASIVINEIMYHPEDSNPGGEFIELHNASDATVDVSGWSFTRGVSYLIPDNTTIDAGGFLVVARDPVALMQRYDISGVLGPWDGRLQNDNENVLLRDPLGNQRDKVRYADEGSWPEQADGLGPSVELVHPALENRYGPAWRTSDDEGTPGTTNSRLTVDSGPLVVGVRHHPVIPNSEELVRVIATVSDVEPVSSVQLFFQVSGGDAPRGELGMVDDGTHDDGVAENGVYGAELPPHPDRTIIEFWVRATGADDQSVAAPPGGSDRPFLYQVEELPRADIRPTYRLILRATDLNELQSRGRNSDVLLDATFVAGNKAFYNRGLRYRGSSARTCNPLSYRIQFDHDTDFHGIKRLNINGCAAYRQWIGLDFLRRTDVPTPLAWFRRLSFNGQLENGWYLRVEAIDDSFLERSFPGDADGNLYRGMGNADLDYRGPTAEPYRPHYEKVTNESLSDFTDVVDLCARFDRGTTEDKDFPAAIDERVDHVQWANYFAAYGILGSSENSIVLNNGDDYFLYHRFSDDRWVLLPWDLDSVFDVTDQELFRPRVESIRRFLRHPFYASTYWCELESLLENAFETDLINTRISHLEPLFSAAIVANLRRYATARRRVIEGQLSQDLEITSLAGASICGESTILLDGKEVSIQGEAPGCGTQAVTVNDTAATYDPTTTIWRSTVELRSGENLRVTALDRDLLEVAALEYSVLGSSENSPTVRVAVLPAPEVELLGESVTVTLDGSRSHDGACGTDSLTYLWEKVLGPADDVFKGDVISAIVDVELRTPGEYTYRLTVSDTLRPASINSAVVSVFVTSESLIRNRFLLCDSNGDFQHGISDPVFTLDALFRNANALPCEAAGDCNSDGTINLSDAIFDLRYQFLGQAAPREPFPECDERAEEECSASTCRD